MAVNWGSAAWWTVVLLSVPFSAYASVFLIGDFDVYRKFTIAWNGGKFDTAGLHILHNLRAWQVHVAGAYLFMLTAPFQFSPKFRQKYPANHRRLGYAFVLAVVVTAVSALAVLTPNTEFGNIGKVVLISASPAQLFCVFAAVKSARAKQFTIHREYMIRTAAMGYAVINSRIVPGFLQAWLGVEYFASLDYGLWVSFLLNVVLAELYIWSTSRQSSGWQKNGVALPLVNGFAESSVALLGVSEVQKTTNPSLALEGTQLSRGDQSQEQEPQCCIQPGDQAHQQQQICTELPSSSKA